VKIPASTCKSRPDCPCDFYTGLRTKIFCYRRNREMGRKELKRTDSPKASSARTRRNEQSNFVDGMR
jgi:hypothetical protein